MALHKHLIEDAASKESYCSFTMATSLGLWNCFHSVWTETEREYEYVETHGRSEYVATPFCLVSRKIKCYVQIEPGEHRKSYCHVCWKRRREYFEWLRGHGRLDNVDECKTFPTDSDELIFFYESKLVLAWWLQRLLITLKIKTLWGNTSVCVSGDDYMCTKWELTQWQELFIHSDMHTHTHDRKDRWLSYE